MRMVNKKELYEWCSIPFDKLVNHPDLKIPFRLCDDSNEMGQIMAEELVNEIRNNNAQNKNTVAIIPCGPSCWYKPFTDLVNKERVSLKNFVVYHMDECLDWQGRELPSNHPYSFKGFMEKNFYDPVDKDLAVRQNNRNWLNGNNIEKIKNKISEEEIDITYGGWGQDGHVAYNQSRRHPFHHLTFEDIRSSTVRIQDNNIDTIIALAQRTFGSAYQFVPPMSVTLGMKECLSGKKIRLFSDTGAWKQTALRVALFSPVTPEYPITLLQEHSDALITATVETAKHPVSEHPEWNLGLD
jgi:glucosamine-6-phosphate deaminase